MSCYFQPWADPPRTPLERRPSFSAGALWPRGPGAGSLVLAPERVSLGRDSACEARYPGRTQGVTVDPRIFSAKERGAQRLESALFLGSLETASGPGSEVFFSARSNLQLPAHSPHRDTFPRGPSSTEPPSQTLTNIALSSGPPAPAYSLSPFYRDREMEDTLHSRPPPPLSLAPSEEWHFPARSPEAEQIKMLGRKDWLWGPRVFFCCLPPLLTQGYWRIRKFQTTRKFAEEWEPRKVQPIQQLAFLLSVGTQFPHQT